MSTSGSEGLALATRYAKRAKTSRLEWNTFTKEYFLKRESLAMVLLLVDGSIPPQAIDLECARWLAESEVISPVSCTDMMSHGLTPSLGPYANVH